MRRGLVVLYVVWLGVTCVLSDLCATPAIVWGGHSDGSAVSFSSSVTNLRSLLRSDRSKSLLGKNSVVFIVEGLSSERLYDLMGARSATLASSSINSILTQLESVFKVEVYTGVSCVDQEIDALVTQAIEEVSVGAPFRLNSQEFFQSLLNERSSPVLVRLSIEDLESGDFGNKALIWNSNRFREAHRS